jgi:hypothetical protein
MKPHVVGSACHRVHRALDEALGEGVFSLPPELRSHAARCARCGPEVADTEALLARLRGAAAGIDMGHVPRVVDHVMAGTLAGLGAPSPTARTAQAQAQAGPPAPGRRPDLRWLLGQLAVVAAVMLIALGGTTYTVLKLQQVLGGTSSSQVAERLTAPFRDMVSAVFHNAR